MERSLRLSFAAIACCLLGAVTADGMTAQCDLLPTTAFPTVSGTIMFEEMDEQIQVSGEVMNLSQGEHGFHVHANGATTNECLDAGGHFNPFDKNHGAPSVQDRHVGDLGNIDSDGNKAMVAIGDGVIKFSGEANIIGKALVVHADRDDLGDGGQPDSLTTGHAGARVACCVIRDTTGDSASHISAPVYLLMAAVTALLAGRIM